MLRELRNDGPLSRTDLARRLGYNYRTTTLLIDELAEEGLVLDAKDAPTSSRGRPAALLRLNGRAASVAGLSFTANRVDAIVVDLAGKTVARGNCDQAWASSNGGVTQVADTALSVVMPGTGRRAGALAGIGVSIPEPIGFSPGACADDPLYEQGGVSAQLVEHIAENHGTFGVVDSRTRNLALACYWFGTGREYRRLAFLNLGEQADLALLVDGRLLRGARGYAGEVCLLADQPDQASGNNGSAFRGKGAREFFERLVVETAVFYNPEVIVIGGADEDTEGEFVERARHALDSSQLPDALRQTQVRQCTLRDAACAYGGAAAVYHRIFNCTHLLSEHMI